MEVRRVLVRSAEQRQLPAAELPAGERHQQDEPRPGHAQQEAFHRYQQVQQHEGLHRLELVEEVHVDGLDQVLPEGRSEEHTSELQSLMRISYAVFCLKKKHANNKIPQEHT